MNDLKKINDAYEDWAKTYDNDKNLTRDLDFLITKEHKHLYENKILLEPGCGTGKNTIQFSKYARNVTSFDSSNAMLEIAQDKIEDKNVIFLT